MSAEGETTVSVYGTDAAGNVGSAQSVTVLVDTTAPVIAYAGNAGTYTIDQMVNITCTRSDAMSGVDPATDACVDINGSALDFGVGVHTVTSSVADIKAVSAQSGKALSEADAATLIRLAEELMGQ